MAKNLAIDLGNTRTKIGVFEGNDFIEKRIIDNNRLHHIKQIVEAENVGKVILSSVNKLAEKVFDESNIDVELIRVNNQLKLPFDYKYKTIETLGADRIAVVAAAQKIFSAQDALIVDVGSCITYDFIDKKGMYFGGAISPGVRMRLRSMHHFTNALPLIDWKSTTIPEIIGDSTKNSLNSGAIHGAIAEINAFISIYKQEYKALKVILTGGDANFFEKALKNSIFADPNLVLKGLNELLIYNSE